MERFRLSRVLVSGVAALIVLVGITGCDSKPEMAKVKGKVAFKDGTIPRGGMCVVRFQPTDDTTAQIRKGASGNIGPDGTFEMWTRMPGDGVYLGKYAVSFAIWQSPTDPRTSLVSQKYSNPTTSGYVVEVTDDRDDLNFVIEPLAPAAAGSAAAGATPPAGS